MADTTRLLIEKSWTLFVDGENFTKRGQGVLKEAGHSPIDGPFWRRDVFLWLPGMDAASPFICPSRLPAFLKRSRAASTARADRHPSLLLHVHDV